MSKRNEDDEEDDVISLCIGRFGRWQILLTFLLSFVNLPCIWHMFSPTFIAENKHAWCARHSNFSNVDPDEWQNLTQPEGICTIIDTSQIDTWPNPNITNWTLIDCEEWEFSGVGTTIISEFSLLCNRSNLLTLAEMMFLIGVAFGGFVSGIISDKFGRKKALLGSSLLQTLIGTILAVTPGLEMFLILRLLLGFATVSVVFTGFVLSIELVDGKWRTIIGIAYLFPQSFSYAIISGIAYLLRDWRDLQLAISIPGILFMSYWWILPESPRWLLAMGKKKELKKTLENAAKTNRRILPQNFDKMILPVSSTQDEAGSVKDLFRTPKMRKITLFLAIIWFAVYIVYFGLVLNVGGIGGNLYVNSIVSGIIEFPALAVSIIFLLKLGRRWPMSLTLIFTGIFCLLVILVKFIVSDLQWLITTLTMIARLLVSSSNAVIPLYTAELYPTALRNLGVGAGNLSAGIALILVPTMIKTESIHFAWPMFIIGAFGLVGGGCVLFLPETKNAPLKSTLTEEEED